MTTGVQTVAPDVAAADAWELMRRKRIHHLVVTDGSRVVGVLSDRDVGGPAGGAIRDGASVSELMTVPVVSLAPNAPLRKAANLMRGRTIGCIPVTDANRLVGIVTISDLLEVIGQGGGRAVKGRRPPLHYRVPHRKTHRGSGTW